MNNRCARWLVVLGAGCLAACGSSGKKADGGSPRDGAASEAGDASDTSLPDVSKPDLTAADASCSPACATNKACVRGACLTAPVLYVTVPACGAARLAILDGSLYWTEQATGSVRSLATATPGGMPSVLSIDEQTPDAIAVDGTGVYWSNDADFSIVHTTVGGGGRTKVATAAATVSSLIARAGTIYYGAGASAYAITPVVVATPDAATADAATDAAAIDATAADAATASWTSLTLMTFPACHPTHTGALALDVDHLYETDFMQQFLSRERIDGQQLVTDPCATTPATAPKIQAPDTISHSQGELLQDALAVVGGQLIWADRATLYAKADDGTAVSAQVLAMSANSNPITGFVVSGSNIYLGETGATNDLGGDTIEVTPLDPGDAGTTTTASIVATGQRLTSQFVADITGVYWVRTTAPATAGDPDDCEIVGLPN